MKPGKREVATLEDVSDDLLHNRLIPLSIQADLLFSLITHHAVEKGTPEDWLMTRFSDCDDPDDPVVPGFKTFVNSQFERREVVISPVDDERLRALFNQLGLDPVTFEIKMTLLFPVKALTKLKGSKETIDVISRAINEIKEKVYQFYLNHVVEAHGRAMMMFGQSIRDDVARLAPTGIIGSDSEAKALVNARGTVSTELYNKWIRDSYAVMQFLLDYFTPLSTKNFTTKMIIQIQNFSNHLDNLCKSQGITADGKRSACDPNDLLLRTIPSGKESGFSIHVNERVLDGILQRWQAIWDAAKQGLPWLVTSDVSRGVPRPIDLMTLRFLAGIAFSEELGPDNRDLGVAMVYPHLASSGALDSFNMLLVVNEFWGVSNIQYVSDPESQEDKGKYYFEIRFLQEEDIEPRVGSFELDACKYPIDPLNAGVTFYVDPETREPTIEWSQIEDIDFDDGEISYRPAPPETPRVSGIINLWEAWMRDFPQTKKKKHQ
ncbi:MAG: hypothetical protein Q6365_011500 [Candidatus Sigynarchaeota archaeon]